MGLGIVAGSSVFFSGIGSLLGFGLSGPVGALEGAKAGMAVGAQIGLISKGEAAADCAGDKVSKTLDETGQKISKGIDAAGEKIGVAADKTGEAVQRVGIIAEKCLLTLSDVGSKMALTSFASNQGFANSVISMDLFNKYCLHGAFESVNCLSMSSANIAMNAVVVFAGISIMKQLYINVYSKV